MGAKVTKTDFQWVYTDQPHNDRRQEMLKKYPQIKELYGPDPIFKWIVCFLVVFQFVSLLLVQHLSWTTLVCLSYFLGGVINHSLMLAIHEIGHSMAFGVGYPVANKIFGIFANLPIMVPFSLSFKHYHIYHHRYLNDETLDPDVPTVLEAKLFCTTLGKFLWTCHQILFYAFRPLFAHPRRQVTPMEVFQSVLQISVDYFLVDYFGIKAFVYLLLGAFLAMGMHPVAGHFISEHYMYRKGFDTYSYYGPLNYIMFNVGYHVEHHDFPYIPSSRLPMLRKIAPEYYDNLPHHNSFCAVLYAFITDPNVGLYTRLRRKTKYSSD